MNKTEWVTIREKKIMKDLKILLNPWLYVWLFLISPFLLVYVAMIYPMVNTMHLIFKEVDRCGFWEGLSWIFRGDFMER